MRRGSARRINLTSGFLVHVVFPQTEWADSSKSDIVYASPFGTTESLPPILIELQYQVDQDFMLRLIKYASHTYNCYKALHIVLVVVTKSFSSVDFQREFTISRNGLLLEASCKFWAKQCVLLSANAVSNHLNQGALNPMIALGLFLTRHELYQIPKHYRSDAALMLLSSTAKEIQEEAIKGLRNQAKRIFEEIIEENDNRVDSINKKQRIVQKKEYLLGTTYNQSVGETEAKNVTHLPMVS